MNTNDQTAILVFSRFAAEEARVKKYAHTLGKKGGTQLAHYLIDRTLYEAKKSGIPVHTCFLDNQKGKSFGERLANAIEEIFAQGFSNLIVTGTDSTNISSVLFREISKKLSQNPLVLGPAKDGGVYLIGISKQAYQRERFLQIPWLSNAVFDSLKMYATHFRVTPHCEPLGSDIDHVSDLFAEQQTHTFHPLFLVFYTLLTAHGLLKKTIRKTFFFQKHWRATFALRGPPISLS